MKTNVEYFLTEKNQANPKFFGRFNKINFKDLKIIDLGCGHGALSIDLALKGARQVIGIDLNEELIFFAIENLLNNYQNLKSKVIFRFIDLESIKEDDFDLIVSKSSFEHIIRLDTLLVEMKNKLKIGGKIITGFGPLYNSPFGDHNRLRHKLPLSHKLPWAHIIISEKYLIKKLNKERVIKVKNIHDLGLNGLSLKQYKDILYNIEGLTVIDFRTNVIDYSSKAIKKVINKIFNFFAGVPILKEYFTHNIFCVLERVE